MVSDSSHLFALRLSFSHRATRLHVPELLSDSAQDERNEK